jgi:YihY family inner membrane protein
VEHVRAAVRRLDRLQRRFPLSAVTVAVLKKYGDDRGATLSAVVTFYGLLALFPLLLLLFTLAGMLLDPAAERSVVHSALAQFPVVGDRLQENIHVLSQGRPLAFVTSLLFLLWGALGITSAVQHAHGRIWQVPRDEEADLPRRTLRGLLLLGVLLMAVVGGAVLSGAAAAGAVHFGGAKEALRVLVLLGAAALNVVCYLLAFGVLGAGRSRWRALLPGAVVGGVGWTVLNTLGAYLLGHQLQRTSELYGFFAIVLGLIFWLNLGAQLFLLSTELNVVLDRRCWPRHLLAEDEAPRPALAAAPVLPAAG